MGGFDQAARNECMCIFHAKHGAQAQRARAEVTPRCRGTYGRSDGWSPSIYGVYISATAGVCPSCGNNFRVGGADVKQLMRNSR